MYIISFSQTTNIYLSPYAVFLVLPLSGHVPEKGGGVVGLVLEVPVHTGGKKKNLTNDVCLFVC